MSLATVRNILIVVAIATLVAVLPGGSTATNFVVQAVFLLFLGALAWFGSIMYRQHRAELYGLGDARRAILYGALTVAAVTLTGTHKLWSTGPGSVAWLLLMGGALYAVIAIVWSARKY